MKKKIAVIMIMLVLVAMSITTTVNASSFLATMTPNRTVVAESNEVVVTIRVSNLDVGTTGINTFEGVLSYSPQIFETINSDSIEGNNGWQPTYNQENGKIMLYKQGFLNEDANIVQITFKTKTNVTGKTGDIRLSDIKASNTAETIEANSISTRITVGTQGSEDNTNTNTNKNTNAQPVNIIPKANNANTNTNVNTNTSPSTPYVNSMNNTNKNNTVEEKEDIPYTGTSDNIMRAIFVVLVVAGISYFKYESIKEK